MNIFYLDKDPKICAEMHLDKHVVKMIIEYAQLMSTAHRVLDGKEYTDLTANGRRIKRWKMDDEQLEKSLMKASHINHPSGIWVRDNKENYLWLNRMWIYLLKEYTHRYGKHHACEKYMDALYLLPKNFPNSPGFFPPTPAMPPEVKILAENSIPGRKYDSLASYHNYYIKHKSYFAKWTKRPVPTWYSEGIELANI